jgi:predicted RNase H-like nuclease (RuvC/YqgF family)
MPSKAVYARLQIELNEKLKAYADTIGQSVSATVETLIRNGLEQLSSGKSVEALEKEITELKDNVQKLEKERATLQGSLEACKAKESIAMAAQSHAAALQQETEAQRRQIEQLRSYLLTPAAVCRNCNTQLRLFDIGQRKCAYCGGWNMNWLPEYSVPPTTWETIRDGAAAVGIATVVVALLNALGGGQQRS